MSNAKRIGGDWVENLDPSTGKVYYANLVTKAVSWEWPSELPSPSSDDPKDWAERKDPNTGNIYYFNSRTRSTTWSRPTCLIDNGAKESKSDQSEWVERTDPKTGKIYYYNPSTRKTTWENPANMANRENAAATMAESAATPAPSSTGSTHSVGVTSAPVAVPAAAPPPAGGAQAHGLPSATPGAAPASDRFAKLRALKAKQQTATENNSSCASGSSGNSHENSPTVVAKPVDLAALAENLALEVGSVTIEEYAAENFNLNRKGMMGTSLHHMQDVSLTQEAVQAFKNIVSFMGDRQSGKEGGGHAQKLLSNTVNAPEELRDEIFCQLIKQTRNNPSADSTVKGWQLFCICAGTYPPSKKFERYLMSYCDANTKDTLIDGTPVHPGVRPYAQYAMMKVKKSMALGPRRETPTQVEIQATKARQPVVVRVHLVDLAYKTLPPVEWKSFVESWTTIRELSAMMAKKLGVVDPTPFALFEVSTGDEERVLDDDERVLDLLAYWTREFADAKEKGKKKMPNTFQFVYKAVHDVTDSRYPCSEENCHTLAALQAQQRFGDASDNPEVFRGKLSEFLPVKYLKSKGEEEVEAAIMEVYKKLQGYSAMEAKLNYLDYVKSWKIYGSAYFFVEPQNSRDFPSDVVLAINAKGILVVDPETKDFLAEYPYSEVVTWGHSAQTFVLVVGNLIRQVKIYCKTDQGVEMNSLVHAYVNNLLDRQK